MPTVLSSVKSLTEEGLLMEMGELKSTGGRKAKAIGLVKSYRYALGVNITANHVSIVLVNFGGEIVKQMRMKKRFFPSLEYCVALSKLIEDFYINDIDKNAILGVGISLPGILNVSDKMLGKSHALQLENYSLKMLEQCIPFPLYFENDANAAMLAEDIQLLDNAIYLSLNNTLGGAICMNGRLITGENRKAGEFGHMLLFPDGKLCYCGKKGCADAYCAANVLLSDEEDKLEWFMERLSADEAKKRIWDQYLEHLAILISNLRMAYDTDIILGGDVGGYLRPYMLDLSHKILKYNLFDKDTSYIKNCSYQKEASAVGVAKYFFEEFVNK